MHEECSILEKDRKMKRLTNLNITLTLSILSVITGTAKAVPNPAAWYCVQLGYEYQIREDAQGNQYGVCVFPDGSECDGWDYFRKCYYGESLASCEWPCQELPCKQAGESVFLSECCEGLKQVPPAYIYDANCNQIEMPPPGWLPICWDCGNGICEPWESKCNCPEDCRRPRIIYVDADATGTNDGSSWADAHNCLQDALADANSAEKPVEIRVAQGVYKPDLGAGITPGDRRATFQLINSVTLNGGYAGFGEPDPNARDIKFYETILSGDLDGDDMDVNDPTGLRNEPTRVDNSYHVVTGSGTDPSAMIDGLSVTGGNATYGSSGNTGGGMYNVTASPTITNCTFIANSAEDWGGGTGNRHGSTPRLTKCTFIENYCNQDGGGIFNGEGSAPSLEGCAFIRNRCRRDGAGICNSGSSNPTLDRCEFVENIASHPVAGANGLGGGMMNAGSSSPILTNCTFTANYSEIGGGLFNRRSTATLINCIFSANSARYSGGGAYNTGGAPVLIDCTFKGNYVTEGSGGGMANSSSTSPKLAGCTFSGNIADQGGGMSNHSGSSPTATGCTFSGNTAANDGGAIYSSGSVVGLINCTLLGNSAKRGNTLSCFRPHPRFAGPSSVEVVASIVWDGPDWIGEHFGSTISVTYSDIQGGWPGDGNIDADPLFVDPGYCDPNGTPEDANDDFWVDGDYHLKSQAGRWNSDEGRWVMDEVTSRCIDAGNPGNPVSNERFPNGGIINMGAYGGTAEASKSYFGQPICETIVAGDINGDCAVNFKDFALMAAHWLEDNTPINSDSVVKEGIEYYICTDKSVYHLGENVQILCRVTNLREVSVDVGDVPNCAHGWSDLTITDDRATDIWQYLRSIPPCGWTMLHLEPYDSKEHQFTWDMISDNGTFGVHNDDYLVGTGSYKITGQLRLSNAYKHKRVPVSVSIEIRP